MVALVLLAVGAVALAGGMRDAVRAVGAARAWHAAAFAVESRLEQLRASCTPLPGTAISGPVDEKWSVAAPAGPMLPSVEVADSLTITLPGRISNRVIRSIVRCAP